MNPRKHIILTVIILSLTFVGLIIGPGIGNNPNPEQEQLFEQANHHYENKQYSEATAKYQELLKQGVHSAHIHNNLATSYHRMGEMGKSILHFKKAALMDPYDEEIKGNLAKVQQDAPAYESKQHSFWSQLSSRLSISHWTLLGAFALLVLAVWSVFTIAGKISPSRAWKGITVVTVLGISALAVGAAITQKRETTGQAIVTHKDSVLHVSPFPEATPVAVLQPGKTIRIQSEKIHGDYIQVKLDNGKTGWLRKSNAELIEPN